MESKVSLSLITTPWFSPSGTTTSIVQTMCTTCGTATPVQGTLAGREAETYILEAASWGNYLYIQNGRAIEPLEGPFSAALAASLITARIILSVLAVALMIGLAVWRVRKLQRVMA
jgi:hypothetical protein